MPVVAAIRQRNFFWFSASSPASSVTDSNPLLALTDSLLPLDHQLVPVTGKRFLKKIHGGENPAKMSCLKEAFHLRRHLRQSLRGGFNGKGEGREGP